MTSKRLLKALYSSFLELNSRENMNYASKACLSNGKTSSECIMGLIIYPTRPLQFVTFVHLLFSVWSLLDLFFFATSLALMEGTSCCVYM